jgi:hypothetical protein
LNVQALLLNLDERLKTKALGVICLYVREGSTFGDVVHAVDLLRETSAKTVAVSHVEIPYGKNP